MLFFSCRDLLTGEGKGGEREKGEKTKMREKHRKKEKGEKTKERNKAKVGEQKEKI